MNPLIRMILHGVASGNVTLTPQVLKILKDFSQDHPGAGEPDGSANEPSTSPEDSAREASASDPRLTFVNPLPGRWIRRTG